jgi:hypothetical protein
VRPSIWASWSGLRGWAKLRRIIMIAPVGLTYSHGVCKMDGINRLVEVDT